MKNNCKTLIKIAIVLLFFFQISLSQKITCKENEYEKSGVCKPCYYYQQSCVEKCPKNFSTQNEGTKICDDDSKENFWSDGISVFLLVLVILLFVGSIAMAIVAKLFGRLYLPDKQSRNQKIVDESQGDNKA